MCLIRTENHYLRPTLGAIQLTLNLTNTIRAYRCVKFYQATLINLTKYQDGLGFE
jgi:hypothetical protein